MFDHSQFRRTLPPAVAVEHGSPYSWRYYRFSRARLAQLKSRAMEVAHQCPESVPYISTNDALTAFCWQRIASVRHGLRKDPSAQTKLCRAVNARAALKMPREYMGDLVTIAMSRFNMAEITNASLSTVAGTLRMDLRSVNNEQYIRSFATFLANEPDSSIISYGGNFNPETDIGSSSWADVQLYGVEFGLLGKPVLVRRPDFAPLKSDIYFMPQTEVGDIDALLCMNQADFDGLKNDIEWNEYADYIG